MTLQLSAALLIWKCQEQRLPLQPRRKRLYQALVTTRWQAHSRALTFGFVSPK